MKNTRRTLAALVVCVGVVGCGGGDGENGPTDPPPATPDFTMTVTPTTLTVVASDPAAGSAAAVSRQGSVDIQVSVTRSGGFTGGVSVTVSGLPSGVTASALTIDGGQTSGTVTLTAAASASAGTAALTVSGAAAGIATKTASVSLTVEADSPTTGSIGITLSASSVTLTQGESSTQTVTISRTDFTGAVALSATSDPAGVAATFDPASTMADASTLTLSAGAGLTPGSYVITVTASGAGVSDATASMNVTVNQSTGGGGSIQFTFCEQSGIPDWFAVQDGGGAWSQVVPNPPNVFSFDINSATGAFAIVTDDSGGAIVQVYYASRQEIEAFATSWCVASGLTKTVMGSFAGLQAGETGTVTMGGGFASTFTGTNFTLENVQDGSVDLVASASGFTGGANPSFFVRKLVIRRDLNPTDGSTLPVIDFGSGEAFDPVQFTVTVGNGMGQQLTSTVAYTTANGGFSSPFFSNLTGAGQGFGVPASQQADGDLHWLTATATDIQGQTFVSSRGVTRFFKTAGDQTVTLGPVLNQPTVTVAGTTPYVRPRAELVVQSEYDDFWSLGYTQNGGNISNVLVLPGFGVAGTLDVTVPDFSGVSGWNNDWGLQTGSEITWSAIATGWDQAGFPGQPGFEEGNLSSNSTRFGTINP